MFCSSLECYSIVLCIHQISHGKISLEVFNVLGASSRLKQNQGFSDEELEEENEGVGLKVWFKKENEKVPFFKNLKDIKIRK